jgi:hypothetical protein
LGIFLLTVHFCKICECDQKQKRFSVTITVKVPALRAPSQKLNLFKNKHWKVTKYRYKIHKEMLYWISLTRTTICFISIFHWWHSMNEIKWVTHTRMDGRTGERVSTGGGRGRVLCDRAVTYHYHQTSLTLMISDSCDYIYGEQPRAIFISIYPYSWFGSTLRQRQLTSRPTTAMGCAAKTHVLLNRLNRIRLLGTFIKTNRIEYAY